MEGISKSFAYTETSITHETSPVAVMAFNRAKEENTWKRLMLKMNQDERFHNDNMMAKSRANDIAMAKVLQEGKKENGDITGKGGLVPIPEEANQLPDLTAVRTNIGSNEMKSQVLKGQIMQTAGLTEENLENLKESWKKSSNSVDPGLDAYFTTIDNLEKENKNNKQLVLDAQRTVDAEYATIYESIPEDLRMTTTIDTPMGVIEYSPEELVDFNDTFKSLVKYKPSGNPFGGFITEGTYELPEQADIDGLSPKERVLYDMNVKMVNRKIPLNEGERMVMQHALDLKRKVNNPYSIVIQAKNDKIDKYIHEHTKVSQGKNYVIPTDKAKFRADLAGKLGTAIKVSKDSKGISNSPNFNKELAAKHMVDPNVKGQIVVTDATQYNEATYTITTTGEDGKQTSWSLTGEEMGEAYDDFFSPSSQKTFLDKTEAIMSLGSNPYTTSTDGKPTSQYNGQYSKSSFPRVDIFGIEANVEKTVTGMYILRMVVWDPLAKNGKGQWKTGTYAPKQGTQSGLLGKQLEATFSGLDDSFLYNMLYGEAPTTEDLEAIKKHANKAKY